MEFCRDFDYSKIIKLKGETKKVFARATEQGKSYIYDIECAFDIETTSYEDETTGKVSFMYIWIFGIGEHVIYGRTWEDFVALCEFLVQVFELNIYNSLVCYAHALSFEFQFIKDYFTWYNVFTVADRKPIRAVTTLGIEFRDSYILSGMNLDKTADNLTTHKIKKLYGNLDYTKVRTYETPLTKQELDYCKNDVVILLYYIREQITIYGNLARVPLTNTGRVRKFMSDKCFYTSKSHRKSSKSKYIKYSKLMQYLTITKPEYIKLKRALQGGYTHGNSAIVGEVLEDVTSIDLASSYPAVMLTEKYPMGRGFDLEIDNKEAYDVARKKYALVFDIKFTGLESSIDHENYISESKCIKLENGLVNNGRVFSADSLVMTITDVDFSIIERVYTWDNMQIKNVTAYEKSYLPKPIIEGLLELYADKTTLKGVKGKETEYMVKKGMTNSIYGMSITDIIRHSNTYNAEKGWHNKDATTGEQLNRYNNSRKRFLFYPWGVFITAYARRNLWGAILEFGNDYVYSDTDSVKGTNIADHQDYIDKFNNIVMKKLIKMADYHGIDHTLLRPKTNEGTEKPIGMWENEGTYTRFKTLGAKRYISEKDGKMELTVSGLSKDDGLNYMLDQCNNDFNKVFDMFNDDLYIPAEYTGKMAHTYIDTPAMLNVTDYLGNTTQVLTLSGVHLENCDFTLSVSKEYNEFIEKIALGYQFQGVSQRL